VLALLFETAIRALVLGALTWVTLSSLHVRNPYVEKLVWRTVLSAALALPALLYWQLAPVLEVSMPALAVAVIEPAADGSPASASAALPMIALGTLYLMVTTALLVRFAAGFARLARLSRAAKPLPAGGDVRISAGLTGPATFGSIVLLPSEARQWSAAELDVVLSHERAHVDAHDCHWQWLAQIHAIVFWFSPFAWLLRRRLSTLAEATSDESVIAAKHDHVVYAQLLLHFARKPYPGRAAMSASGPKISARIDRILSRVPPASPPRRTARALAFALLIPAALFAAASISAPADPAQYEALDRNDPAAAHIVDFGDLGKLGDHYPPLAKQERVAGSVLLGATLDAEGNVIEVVVLDEQPAEPHYGFGAAALEVARTVRFANPRKAPIRVKFRVKFTLAS
jgi:TonB family protein